MSAPDKKRQPIITTTGKRGYIRICVRCGKTLVGVGQRTKRCRGRSSKTVNPSSRLAGSDLRPVNGQTAGRTRNAHPDV